LSSELLETLLKTDVAILIGVDENSEEELAQAVMRLLEGSNVNDAFANTQLHLQVNDQKHNRILENDFETQLMSQRYQIKKVFGNLQNFEDDETQEFSIIALSNFLKQSQI
jgi:hypothetical protein